MSVQLTPITEDHVPLLVHWAGRREFAEFFRHHPPLMNWFNVPAALQAFAGSYMIINEAKVVGIVQLVNNNPYARSISFGALIDVADPKLRSQISTDAHCQIVDYVFDVFQYRRLSLKILENRKQLINKLEDFGFKLEGTLRKSCRINGEEYNEVIMGLLKEDWNGTRNTSIDRISVVSERV